MDAPFAAGAPLSRAANAEHCPSPPAIKTLDRVRLPPLFAPHANDAPLYAFLFSAAALPYSALPIILRYMKKSKGLPLYWIERIKWDSL
jgi:hypothetical protein